MVKIKYRDDTPMKRTLITKGEWPKFAGGEKATGEEKIIFSAIIIALAIIIYVFFIL